MDIKVKRERFLAWANEIKELGYKVFVIQPTEHFEYCCYGWVVNEKDEIGYFQSDEWGSGITFSTVHKPTREFGSGFGLDDEFESRTVFTKEIVDRCFVTVPDWFYQRPYWERKNLHLIKKYTATEFFENYWNKKNVVQL